MTDNLRGAGWILMSSAAATAMTVGVRALAAADIPSMETAFARSVVGLALILPIALARGGWPLSFKRWKLHLLRGLLGVGAINAGFYAVSTLPLATVTVIFFTAPLFVTIFAGPILGERVGWRRWVATGIGFLGTLIVMEPGTANFHPVMLIAATSSVMFALILVIGKKLSTTESPYTMMLYASTIMTIGSLPPALTAWRPPGMVEIGLMVLVGAIGTFRTYFDIRGYAAGEASFVAPFQYLRIVLAAAAGYFLFAELPGRGTLAGATVIIASTLYIAHRERRHGRLPRADAADAYATPTRRRDDRETGRCRGR